jgi:peptidoglycan/LPS O-acetylase OafA/YrhL
LPLIPALLLTAVLDHLGLWYLDYKELMLNLNPFYPDWWHLEWTTSVPVLLSNLLFSQMLLTEQYGTNLSLWTLSNEFWYYLAFPLILLAIYRRSFLAVVLLVLIVLFFISVALNANKPCCTLDRTIIYVTGFVVWCIGALASIYKRTSSVSHVISVLLFGIGIYWYQKYPNLTFMGDVGFSFIMLPLLANAYRLKTTLPIVFNQLSLMSYSLYLIHLPVIVFCLAIVHTRVQWQVWVTMHVLWVLSFVVLFVLFIGYLFYKLFEAHYHVTATWLLKKLD